MNSGSFSAKKSQEKKSNININNSLTTKKESSKRIPNVSKQKNNFEKDIDNALNKYSYLNNSEAKINKGNK